MAGPEDTRYFDDEEGSDFKKFVKKKLDVNKEFSGNSLAFVGYNFTHNNTAEVKYLNGSNSNSSGGKGASTQPKAIDPAVLAENQTNKAKVKELDLKVQELQKYKSTAENTIQKYKSEYEYANNENMQLTTSLESMKRKINEAREQAGQLQRCDLAHSRLRELRHYVTQQFSRVVCAVFFG